MTNGLTDQHAQVRQAAAYGIGLMTLTGGTTYENAYAPALQLLVEMIKPSETRVTEEDITVGHIAISTVVKILKSNTLALDLVNTVREETSQLSCFHILFKNSQNLCYD